MKNLLKSLGRPKVSRVIERSDGTPLSPNEALARIKRGNARFAAGQSIHPRSGREAKAVSAKGQNPHTIILGCSDSRLAAELIFDQGLGDLFVVRVAGNIADTNGIASIEYAYRILGAKLIVVLGHEMCGAVMAACNFESDSQWAAGLEDTSISKLVGEIIPAVRFASSTGGEGPLLDRAIAANVQITGNAILEKSPAIYDAVQAEQVRIVGAIYSLQTNLVEFVEIKHPLLDYSLPRNLHKTNII